MGSLYVVATPIGNLADLSLRAIEVLKSCDLIAAEDTRHTKRLLDHYGIGTRMISYYKFNEAQRTQELIQRIAQEGISVALVSDAGTPCISDPGGEIVREARERGIPVYGVSGPSALVTALSVSGLPARSFTFLGFLPREASAQRKLCAEIRERGINTFVLYESPRRILELADLIQEEFPEARVCFCSELTKRYEKAYYGPIASVAARLKEEPSATLGEYAVVVHVLHRAPDAKPPLSLQALLVDTVVRTGCSLKEAVGAVAQEHSLSRKEVYKAALDLRSRFGDADA